jgi:hypothetical protein
MAASSPKESGKSIYSLYVFSSERKTRSTRPTRSAGNISDQPEKRACLPQRLLYLRLEFFFRTASTYSSLTYGQWYDALFSVSQRHFIPAQSVT